MPSLQSAGQRLLPALFITFAIIIAGYSIRHTFSCFLLAFILAYLLDPFVSYLELRKVPRKYGIVILYIILGISSVFFFIYLVPILNSHWSALIHAFPFYLQKAKEIAVRWEGGVGGVYTSDEWRWLIDNLVGGMDNLLSRVGSWIYAAATKVVFNIFNLILAPVLVFFMLFYKVETKNWITGLLPSGQRHAIIDMGSEINASIGGYLRGQLVISLIVTTLVTVALFALDVDYALINGIFAGMASALPFIGIILAALPPIFFAYIKFQNGIVVIKVIVAFVVIYFLEGYIVKPLVFKEALDLNPLATIITIMALGELIGFWGILLAIPIAAAVKIFLYRLHRGDFSAGG